MTKQEMKARINSRIDEDDEYAQNVGAALEANDESWLESLVRQVIGVVTRYAIEFIKSLFS